MTKVTGHIRGLLVLAGLAIFATAALTAQETPAPVSPVPGVAAALYQQLGSVGLDPARVFHIRNASIEHPNLHVTFNDGTIAFTKDVLGRITGAYFEGEGDLLIMPPNRAERASLGLFTGTAILEEQFTAAYLRFNDDTEQKLQSALYPATDVPDFFATHDSVASSLAASDALRLLMTFSRFLPVAAPAQPPAPYTGDDHFLHLRLNSPQRGLFDVFFDSLAREQVAAGQLTLTPEGDFYDLWTSFSLPAQQGASPETREQSTPDVVDISRYRIRARITFPHELSANALLELEVHHSGERALFFELSRFLQVKRVEADGRPVEFVHNPALDGTQLARRGNDVVAVVFPEPLHAGQRLQLRFEYAGSVLSEAGGGLLYVGARGTWYPNRGLAMSQFDLQFRYPAGWTLVATGKQVPPVPDEDAAAATPGEQVGHWVSEHPMPMAGFNLGQYVKAVAHTGKVAVDTYAAAGVERTFPHPPLPPTPVPSNPEIFPAEQLRQERQAMAVPPPSPSPARNAQAVADETAHAIAFLSSRLGPFPYSSLSLTQMPGGTSQGWPGLIYLSSLAFLTPHERETLHFSPQADVLYGQVMPAHEAAHQWWGDLVGWKSYRDQWIGEALANYCVLMMLEREHPREFELMMQTYRQQLLQKNKAGMELREAGPVTLGVRLSSSKFPDAYDAIAYGRGTWLFHMLRYMLRDADSRSQASGRADSANEDDVFLRVLRILQERFAGKVMTLRGVQEAFEENLPRPLWYEGRKSLDWFFDGWVNGTAIPRLQLAGPKFLRKGNFTVVTGTIKQEDAPADLVTSVPVYAVAGGRTPVLLGRVFADGPETSFRLRAPVGAHKLLLDPYQTVLTRSR
ncbi:MAG TPA: M1 family aminopeptidase [Terriglobales bacterium]|nr:M1 family aminopeptidase [Terriglobales bacterium]